MTETPTKTVKKTRIQWAKIIRAAHMTTVKAILELGRVLKGAKEELEHGEFLAMIESDLPFTASTAQRLMKIASDPKLQKLHAAQFLPAAWGTLYELTKLDDQQFEQAIASGAIHPEITRDEVVNMRPRYISQRIRDPDHEAKLDRNRYSAPAPETRPPLDLVAPAAEPTVIPLVDLLTSLAKLHQIDRLVGELQAQIERGELIVDVGFSLLAQSIAERLRAMAAQVVQH